ncbi:MAG: 2Fe-2S iron-sulfur cluster-binding protein, partial [Actinobacteria bacterium]|nr:2Fe-2S iron-sulfur cluster-binding protein [Actinomycetota bacterium]
MNEEATKDGELAVRLEPAGLTVRVPADTVIEEAISQAGLRISLPCGGQGRCGRCVVEVREGSVRRRSMMRRTEEEGRRGYA